MGARAEAAEPLVLENKVPLGEVSGRIDHLAVDLARQRVYVTCGEGFLDVFQRQGDAIAPLARLATVSGARTALFVSELDRLYVAVRARGAERAALWVYRPAE